MARRAYAGDAIAGPDRSGLSFGEARLEDWPEIWEIFQSVVSAGDTYPYPADISEGDAFSLWMKLDAERGATFIARSGERTVATAYVKANGVGLSDHISNAGWMVDPECQGKGIGRAFAGYVIDRARDFGYQAMQFNSVVATNTAAIALWESLGFEIVGTVPEAFRHATEGLVPVHVMYRQL